MPKTFVITGAGSGLGKALAQRFANDGDNVILLGRSLEKLETAAADMGKNALAIACDVSSPDSVRAAFASIGESFQTIDVLINNAVYLTHGQVVDASDEQILSSFNTNSIGPVLCARAAIPMMKAGSHIISVSSGAVENNYPALSIYASSKAALECFSDALFNEIEPLGIRVTSVRCGQMVAVQNPWETDPAIAAMVEKALEDGWDPRTRPSTTFASVTDAFRAIVDLPADLSVRNITLKPRATS